MSEYPETLESIDQSAAARSDDGGWRTGWLAVLWEGESYGYADLVVTAGAGAEITFNVFWQDALRPMYRIDVDPGGQRMTVLKNYDGWLDEIGVISYDDDGNAIGEDGELVDLADVDPFQSVNEVVAPDEDAVLIAALMQEPPFAVEELFTRVMAVVGNLTAYTERWAHRFLRNSTAEDEPEWDNLWRPVDIGDGATSFPIEDAGPGPAVQRVDAGVWQGYHLTEEKVSAFLDEQGQSRSEPLSAEELSSSVVGEPISIDEVPDAVQTAWYRIWNIANITYEPMMS